MRNFIDILNEWQQPEYLYVTCCVDGGHGPDGEAIHDMTDKETEIGFKAFVEAVGIDQMAEVFPMYDWNPRGKGMKMKDDYAVKDHFYKSEWYGIPCVFVVWSAVEYIFTKGGATPESEGIDREDYLNSLDD